MNREELIRELKKIKDDENSDQELRHIEADRALMEFINDKEIKAAYDDISKWYA